MSLHCGQGAWYSTVQRHPPVQLGQTAILPYWSGLASGQHRRDEEDHGSAQKRWEEKNKGGPGCTETQSQQLLKQGSSLWTVTSVWFTELPQWQKEGTWITKAFAEGKKRVSVCVVRQCDYDFLANGNFYTSTCLFHSWNHLYRPTKVTEILQEYTEIQTCQ